MPIYLVTYHAFNHVDRMPVDSRFLEGSGEYIYYLIDRDLPPPLSDQNVVFEYQIDPKLHEAGGKHFGEWSFLLAEAKHAFCRYPLFMISSRFYEKNHWLIGDLNSEWERLFGYLERYGWGFLPSYDRPFRWIDLRESLQTNHLFRKKPFSPFKKRFFETASEIFEIKIPEVYRYVPDLFCHYIGFQSREHLLRYVNFYRPLIEHFFDHTYTPKVNLNDYVIKTGHFRNEKPFTFLLEALSHLFFYQTHNKAFTLHYDGYYELDERDKKTQKLYTFPSSRSLKWKRQLDWQWRRLQSESILSPAKQFAKQLLKKI